jgi:glycosyltransferase involved in cell wall biosynthesis
MEGSNLDGAVGSWGRSREPEVVVSRPLDVLIVSQPVSYGVAVYVHQLTEAAVAAGHRVEVVSPGADRGPLAGWIAGTGADHRTLNMARRPAVRDALDLVRLRRLARGKDIVHLHSSKAAALGRVAARSLGRRRRPAVVVTAHYWSWLVGGTWARAYRWIERLLARRCDMIVAVSEREAVEGRAVLGPSAPLRLIPNGVDRARFSPHGASGDRDADVPLLVCVGRLSHQKGQDVAIRALALLRDGAARLRLVGSESEQGERAQLEALAGELGVADRIEWRGAVDDTAPEYRAADVVVAPSRWDGLSLALLEAMASGATIVATDVSGSESLGDAGVIVAPDDPRALADAIDSLLGDAARRQRLGEAARTRSGSFDLASTMRQNLELWSGLAVRRAGADVPAPAERIAEQDRGRA